MLPNLICLLHHELNRDVVKALQSRGELNIYMKISPNLAEILRSSLGLTDIDIPLRYTHRAQAASAMHYGALVRMYQWYVHQTFAPVI